MLEQESSQNQAEKYSYGIDIIKYKKANDMAPQICAVKPLKM